VDPAIPNHHQGQNRTAIQGIISRTFQPIQADHDGLSQLQCPELARNGKLVPACRQAVALVNLFFSGELAEQVREF